MTPSKRRREGRRAYMPYENPMEHNPYLNSREYMAAERAVDWLEGWKQAEKEYLEDLEEQEHPCCPHCGKELI